MAERSSHSRGSTVDLTLIREGDALQDVVVSTHTLEDGSTIPFLADNTLDMGSSFDLFHEASHHDTPLINAQALRNRSILKEAMMECGFVPYDKEWWHYTLADEPFKDTYHDFTP